MFNKKFYISKKSNYITLPTIQSVLTLSSVYTIQTILHIINIALAEC